jgi:hypothetical protein
MPDDPSRRRKPARAAVAFSEALAEILCARVAAGESQLSICAEPGMPSRATLWRWVKTRPAFAEAFWIARVAGGVEQSGGPPSSFCQATADEVFRRLCEGESLTAICADPAMPAFSTLYYWRRRKPAFAEAMRVAREIQAERYCDKGWEIAQAITPESARADRVKLAHLRWTAAILAPKRFGRLKPVELDSHWQGGGMTVYIKKYSPETKHPTEDRLLEPGEVAFLKHIPPPERDPDDEEEG